MLLGKKENCVISFSIKNIKRANKSEVFLKGGNFNTLQHAIEEMKGY